MTEKRPRGRPRKEKAQEPPARRVGRPDLPLRDDPARYAVAMIYALSSLGMKERIAARMVAAFVYGEQDDKIDLESLSDKVKRHLASKGQDDQALFQFTGRGLSASLESKGDSLRKKARGRWDAEAKAWGWAPDDSAWLASMGLAFAACFGAVEPVTGKNAAMTAADAAGERAYCETVLFRMIEAQFPG